MSYLYTETCTLPVSGLDDCTHICCCQLCTRHHHHFRCLPYHGHYWTYLRKRSFLLNRHYTYCYPLWFSWKPFQNFNSYKYVYRAISHLRIIKRNRPVELLWYGSIYSLYWPLSLFMLFVFVFTSSSSLSSFSSPSGSLKSLLIWNYKLCSVTDLSFWKKLHLCVKHCKEPSYVFTFYIRFSCPI